MDLLSSTCKQQQKQVNKLAYCKADQKIDNFNDLSEGTGNLAAISRGFREVVDRGEGRGKDGRLRNFMEKLAMPACLGPLSPPGYPGVTSEVSPTSLLTS